MKDEQTQWAIIELMGHQKTAGRYSEHGPMHRVDVPDATEGGFRFTRLYSPQAIYSITFVDEQAARIAVRTLETPAVTVFEVDREIKRLSASVEEKVVIEEPHKWPKNVAHFVNFDELPF